MARGTKEQERGFDRTKGRVFYGEFDGSNESFQEMMRALTIAMGRSQQIMGPQRILSAPQTPENDGQGTESPNPDDVGPDSLAMVDDDVVADKPTPAPARRRRGEGARTDRNAGIEPVADLNFIPDGEPPLKNFFSQKAPRSDLEQVLVLGYYLQHTMGLSTFSPGHILSAFKHVGRPIPVDLRKTIHNMKKSKVWLGFTRINSIRLTTEGDNFVEHQLPRPGGAGESGTM